MRYSTCPTHCCNFYSFQQCMASISSVAGVYTQNSFETYRTGRDARRRYHDSHLASHEALIVHIALLAHSRCRSTVSEAHERSGRAGEITYAGADRSGCLGRVPAKKECPTIRVSLAREWG